MSPCEVGFHLKLNRWVAAVSSHEVKFWGIVGFTSGFVGKNVLSARFMFEVGSLMERLTLIYGESVEAALACLITPPEDEVFPAFYCSDIYAAELLACVLN